MSLEFSNYSMSAEVKYEQPWYDWCVFAAAEKAVIERIAIIQYRLHPSFPNPTRMTEDKLHRFSLVTNGWGEFSIGIDVEYNDGTRESTNYWLRLRDNDWPKKSAPAQFASHEHSLIFNVWPKAHSAGEN